MKVSRTVSRACVVVVLFGGAALRGADCNQNRIDDSSDLSAGTSQDCNANGTPDECELKAAGFVFEEPATLQVGGEATALTAADLNEDGQIDLAAAGGEEGTLSLLWNRGRRDFGDPVVISAGSRPAALTSADLDSDGRVDVVVADAPFALTGGVSVFWNEGEGEFAAGMALPTGVQPLSVAVFDHDSDGELDLAIANFGRVEHQDGEVTVLLNGGNREFPGSVTYQAGFNPSSVIAVDFNLDFFPDLAVANAFSSDVSILLNRGSSGLASPVSYPVGVGPVQLASEDFDGDRDPDLATANHVSYEAAILRNNRNGTFQEPVFYRFQSNAIGVATADLDGDGDVDLAVARQGPYDGDNSVSTLWNDHLGQFEARASFRLGSAGQAPRGLVAADLDGDELVDVATANGESRNLALFFNKAGGGFRSASDFEIGVGPLGLSAADLNGDGRLDLATANQGSSQYPGSLSVLLSERRGGFGKAVSYQKEVRAASVAAGDLNGDGFPDFASANTSPPGIAVLENRGNGALGDPRTYPVDEVPWCVTAFDLDADGDLDLASANWGTPGDSGTSVSLLANRGKDGFAPTVKVPVGVGPWDRPRFLTPADLDEDGRLDLAVAKSGDDNFPGKAVLVLWNSDQGRLTAGTEMEVGASPLSVVAADLDRDGRVDLATANASGTLSVVRNRGNRVFAPPATLSLEGSPQSLTAGDFDGEGYLDLAAVKHEVVAGELFAGGGLSIFFNDHQGGLGERTDRESHRYPAAVLAGDFDGDGRVDLAVASSGSIFSGNLSVLLNQALPVSGGDCNRNGRPDECDIAQEHSQDLNTNGVPDECEPDCNRNGRPDPLDLAENTSRDCNLNRVPDDCDIAGGTSLDCNANGLADECEVSSRIELQARPAFRVANHARSLAAGDFDGDADLDVASVGESRTLDVLSNDGNGLLKSYYSVTTGVNPRKVLSADLDGDQLSDLAVTNPDSDTVSIFLHQGRGFAPVSQLPLEGPYSAAAADVDGDGDLDLAVGDLVSSGPTLIVNQGAGTFETRKLELPGPAVVDLVAADLDGDRAPELTLLTHGGGVTILANRGPAGFEPAGALPTGPLAYNLAAGDLDGDGDLDLATSTEGSLSINFNQGNATFAAAPRALGKDLFLPLAVDLDRDGGDDLAVWDRNAPVHGVTLLFAPGTDDVRRRDVPAGFGPQALAGGDLNGDGETDLLAGFPVDRLGGHVVVLLQSGGGSFPGISETPLLPRPAALAAGDLDGDGDVDVAVAHDDPGDFQAPGKIALVLNAGEETFSIGGKINVKAEIEALEAGDLNGDGRPDLAAVGWDTCWVLTSTGPAAFSAPAGHVVGDSPWALAMADLDGDQDSDLVTTNYRSGGVSVLKNRGDATFLPPASVPAGANPTCTSIQDLDGDGSLDLAVALGNPDLFTAQWVALIRNRDDGDFAAPVLLQAGRLPYSVTGSDFNGDGRVDLAVGNSESNDISLFWNRGNGSFFDAVSQEAQDPWTLLARDFDGDGRIDLVAGGQNFVAVHHNLGSLHFRAGFRFPFVGVARPGSLAAADLNGDGRPDLATVVPSPEVGTLEVMFNRSAPPPQRDCDGNGVPDECDLASGKSSDCNQNQVPDECDLAGGTSTDRNLNGQPDECDPRPLFHRGDANGDGTLDITDGLCTLRYLFTGAGRPGCLESADANNDGEVDCSDGIFVLGYLFLGSSPPPDPGPPPTSCAVDPDPPGSSADLGCESYAGC